MRRWCIALAILASLLIAVHPALARFDYQIGEQIERLIIHTDGKVTLEKEFTFEVLPSSTENGTDVWVGLPTDDTSVLSAAYIAHGQEMRVQYSREENGDEQFVSFTKFPPIKPGESGRFRFTARIPDLVYWLNKEQPKQEPGQQLVAISFIPAWWEKGKIGSLKVMMDFEQSINVSQLEFHVARPEVTTSPHGKTRLVWEYSGVPANAKLKHALIMPRQYFTAEAKIHRNWTPPGVIAVVVAVVLVVMAGIGLLIAYLVKMARYQTPVAYMKGNKAYTTFDPVECAIFYHVNVNLLTQLMIIGLIRKGFIKLTSEKAMRRMPSIERLTWYEEIFLDSVDEQIQIIPDKWKANYEKLISHFFEMVKGYCGTQTINHYTNFLQKTQFSETDDPRWVILQQQLAKGTFDRPTPERLNTLPAYMNSYMPLFYFSIINSEMRKKNDQYYNHVFPGSMSGGGKGGTGGSGCACACACACASSGGCT